MVVLKQLKTKIDGKTTDIYPITNGDAVQVSDTADILDNMNTDLSKKADINSPTFTGTPKVPTAASGTNDTQIATTAFVQTEIDNLINGASEATNTLKELADLIEDNSDLINTLEAATHSHANKIVLDNTTESFTIELKTKLDNIAEGAEVNQMAFSNVVVGSTTIKADEKTDTLTLVGDNVTITPDETNDKVTIGITKENIEGALGYTPGTSFTDTNTTYTLTKEGSNIILTGSDGSKTSVTDDNVGTHTHTVSDITGLSDTLSTHLSKINANTLIIGENDISSISDGTITGAILYLQTLTADLSSLGKTLDVINRTEV